VPPQEVLGASFKLIVFDEPLPGHPGLFLYDLTCLFPNFGQLSYLRSPAISVAVLGDDVVDFVISL